MVFEDEEIERSRTEEQAGSTKAQREAAAKNRTIKLFAAKMKEAKRLKDRHGYEHLLELQNVRRKTAEWNALWEYFYSDEI
jgi:putative heme degradation protein